MARLDHKRLDQRRLQRLFWLQECIATVAFVGVAVMIFCAPFVLGLTCDIAEQICGGGQ